jgi:hypothetical protein
MQGVIIVHDIVYIAMHISLFEQQLEGCIVTTQMQSQPDHDPVCMAILTCHDRDPVCTDHWPGGGAAWVVGIMVTRAGLVSRVGLHGGGAGVWIFWLAGFVRAAAMLGGSGIIKVAMK